MATESGNNQLLPMEPSARVRRKNGLRSLGTVKEIRTEVTASTGETGDKALMVVVDWDNGTQSYFTPNSLVVVK